MKDEKEKSFEEAVTVLSQDLALRLKGIPGDIKREVQEIRLRAGCPVALYSAKGLYFLGTQSFLETKITSSCPRLCQKDIENNFQKICEYSIYSHQHEIINGYITTKGGHRVGIAGTAVLLDGKITGMRDVSSLNLRIARQIFGAADELLHQLSGNIAGTLIFGEPSCGKTTVLRDLARQMSFGYCGRPKKVTIIDERGEIAGTYKGFPQNDVGLCDVLNHYPKGEGAIQAIRSLSPEILICDEIGDFQDVISIKQAANAGVGIIASIHAGNFEELLRRPVSQELLSTGAFKNLVQLKSYHTTGKRFLIEHFLQKSNSESLQCNSMSPA